MTDNKIEELKAAKTPTDSIANQMLESERKKKMEELKKAIEEVSAAKKVLISAVQKAREIETEMRDIDNNKLDLGLLAKSLGI